ncbi:MAG TPA: Calx-beta domain-containing protein [Candidatus Sulfomarinibacteraceae bacterium]|nr:Calx-beta domain-containing protein [Candidatus Sulfomarinibacteraceae bacterium]
MSYLTGQQIEQYQVEALLGEGGMGAVYRAFDRRLQRNVALKLMHAQLAQKPAFRHRFSQEAQAVMSFNCPAIITIHHFSAHEERPYLAMEYVAGGSLADYLQQLKWSGQQFPLTEALTIVAQVAEGLSYAHHRGLVHRDIKPGNILLRRRDGYTGPVEQAIISDFGLAIQTQKGDDEDVSTNPFMGSLPYMSPEQCSNQSLDGRSDIYSLGIVLYHLVTGQLPFKIDAPADVIKHLNEQPLPPALLNPDIPEAVESLILKALAKEPEERFQTGAEVAHAARQALGSVAQQSQQDLRADYPVTQWVDEQWIARIDVANRVDVHQTWTSEGQHRLFITHQWEPSQIADLNAETITIGRAPDNDVVLEDGAVSAHHAVLSRNAQEGWLVKDLGSTNGSFLDNHRLPYDEEVTWNDEQTLRIGPYFLKWQAFHSHASVPAARDGDHDSHEPDPDAFHDNGDNRNGNRNAPLMAAAAGAGLAADPAPALSPPNGDKDTGAPAPADMAPSGDGTLALALTPQQVEVEPGGEVVVQITILNQGVTVEDVQVRVEQQGIASSWIRVNNGAIKLMPDEAKSLTLTIAPPHGSTIEAGQHTFQVLVTTSRGEHASIEGSVLVDRWEDDLVEMHPRKLQEGIDARVSIHNRGNFENRYQLVGIDDADALEFEFDQPRNVSRTDITEDGLWISVPSEEEARIPFTVGAKKRPWLRAPTIPYPFQIRVRSETSDWRALDGQLSVQPRISRRTLLLFLLLLLGVALLGFLGYREIQARNEAEMQRVQATSDAIQATADSLHATRDALQSSADLALSEAEAIEATAAAIEAEDPERATELRATAAAMREEASAVEATIQALQGQLNSTEEELADARAQANVTPTPPPPPVDITLDNLSVPENSGIGATVGVFTAITAAESSNPGNGVAAGNEPGGDHRFMVLSKGQSSPALQSGPRITFNLVSGDGDDDNDAFFIEEATLKTAVDFDYETQNSYSIRVMADNGMGGEFEKPFTIAVEDEDDTPTLSISDVEVDEGAGAATLTVEMENDTQSEVSVQFATSDGSARAGSDFEATDGELVWPPNDSSPKTIEVTIIDDDLDEEDETFRVDLSRPQSAIISASSATVTIIDDDDTPTLAASNVTVDEGDGEATVVVEMDGLSSREVTVNYATSDGSATDGEDYTGASGTLRWQSGEDGEKSFTVSITDDDIAEDDETIRVTLSAPANAIIDQGSATITITDNDELPTLAIQDTGPVQEGGEAAITVQMTGRSSSPVSVQYATADGTARAGADYQATSGTLTWAAGETGAKFIQVPIIPDEIYESPDETFQVILSNPEGATIERDTATFTITDDDEKPRLEIMDATVNESDGVAVVTVRMMGASSQAITVDYATGGGTATAGADYEATSSPPALTWLPEEQDATREIQINILDDDIDEGNSEFFEVVLSLSHDNATISDGVARVTIIDDDEAGFNTSPATLSVIEGEDEETFTIRLLSEPMASVTVPISVNSQCIAPEEIVLDDSNWRNGVQVPISAFDDDIDDGDRNCSFSFGNPSSDDEYYDALSASDVGSLSVTAVDDDTAGVSVDPLSLTVSEPDGVDFFTIVLDSEPLDTVTIPLVSSDPSECEVVSSVQIEPQNWNSGVEVEVRAVDDFVDDGDQPCTVETRGPQSSGDPKYDAFGRNDVEDVQVTVLDDDEAGIIVEPTAVTISETFGAHTATVAISLTSQPEARITIPLTPQVGSDGHFQCEVQPDSVDIRPQDWPELLEFTIVAIDDRRNDGDQLCPITVGPAEAGTAGDNNYDGMQVDGVTVTVQDDDEPGVLIVAEDVSVEEGGDGDTYTIELATEPKDMVTVVITPDGQLDLGSGVGISRTFQFNSVDWDDAVTINVQAYDDDIDEDETHSGVITHTVSSNDPDYDGSGATYFPSNTVSVAITDNDVSAVIITAPGETRVFESGATATYTITLATIPFHDVDVVATPHEDLDLGNGFGEPYTTTVAPADWQTPHVLTISAQDDDVFELDEVVQITHSSASDDPKYQGLTIDDLDVIIVDDDDPPILASSSITVTEQPGGVQATMTVTPTGETVVPFSVDYATVDGTATAGDDDYVAVSTTTLQWPAGDTDPKQIQIEVLDDNVYEGESEYFLVEFSNPISATMPTTQYTVTILDDDEPPEITFTDPAFPEGDNSHQDHDVTLQLVGSSSQAVEVCYSTEDDTAVSSPPSERDYQSIDPGSENCVEWQPEESGERTFTVRIYGDTEDEGLYEQFFINLELTDEETASLPNDQITVTIIDDDAGTVTIKPSTLNLDEGQSDSYVLELDRPLDVGVTATFNITPDGQLKLDGNPAGQAISLDVTSVDGVEIEIDVEAVDDNVVQGSRTVTVTHSAVSSDGTYTQQYDFSPSDAELDVNIADNDSAGVILSTQLITATEGNTTSYELVLASEPANDVTVTAVITEQLDLGAGPGNPQNFTFTPENWSDPQTVSVEPVADDIYEGGLHTALIEHGVASSDANYDEISVPDVQVAIHDADSLPMLSPASALVEVTEGVDENAIIEVTISHASAFPVSVDYETLYTGTAFPGTDYIHTSGTLTWSPEDTAPKTIEIPIVDDDVVESTESFLVQFSNLQNATMIQGFVTVSILDDDASGALPPSGDSEMVQEEREPRGRSGGLAALLAVFALALPPGRRRSRRFIPLLVLGLLLLSHGPALAQSDRLQPLVNHVESNPGSSAMELAIYFTLQGTAPPPGEVQNAALLMEDGSRHEARVEKPPFYVALMMDTSGSMTGTMDIMRQSAGDLIEAAPPETSFAVIEFNEAIRLVQPFTLDRQEALAAVESLEISDQGTCLYDAAHTAVQSLEQLARDAPRRALVLFSDGRDETFAGPCSQNTLEQVTALAEARDVPVPIHTVALSGGGVPNMADLQRIADASNGRLVTRPTLPDFTSQLADEITRQWLARVETYPQQGYQRAALLLSADQTGALPPAPVTFSAQRGYEGPPQPTPILIRDFAYNEITDRFLFDVALADHRQIQALDVTVTDLRTNVRTVRKTQEVILPTEQVSLEAADLQPERRYEVHVVPLAADGEALTDSAGRLLAAEHRFLYELPPGARQLQFQIDELRVKDEPPVFDLRSFRILDDQAELIVGLDLANADDVQQVEGYIMDPDGNLQAGEFVGEIQPNHTVRIPLNLEQGQYQVALRALDQEGAPLAAAESGFSYRPRLTVLQRASQALRQNTILLPLALAPLLLGLVAGWFSGRAIGHRQGMREALDAAPITAPSPAPAERPVQIMLRVAQTPDPVLQNAEPRPLDAAPLTIGREGCDLTIAGDLHVSRRHARITSDDGRYYIEDLGSSNGTFLDDARLAPHQPTLLSIQGETHIRIGKTTELTIVAQEAAEEPQQTEPAEPDAATEPLSEAVAADSVEVA